MRPVTGVTGRPRLYEGTTAPYAFRISHECRALVEYLSARAGVSPSRYMRQLLEQHLEDLGFELGRGVEAELDPDRWTPEGWVRDHTVEGDEAA